MAARSDDLRAFLPLPYLEFQVLVALADATLHGYAIVKDIARRSARQRQPSTGSLYLAIARLLENGLIAEVDGPDANPGTRRTYALTAVGRDVAAAEARRVGELAALARRRLAGDGTADSGNERRGA